MHTVKTLNEIRNAHSPIKSANELYKSRLSNLDKFALWITDHVGTMGFFIIIFTWTFSWLGWNLLAPNDLKFDPSPAFVLWLFISNMIQIFLMPLLLIGQNLQGKHSEARSESDFEVNVKAEKEIETILEHLENQNELILKILKKLEE